MVGVGDMIKWWTPDHHTDMHFFPQSVVTKLEEHICRGCLCMLWRVIQYTKYTALYSIQSELQEDMSVPRFE